MWSLAFIIACIAFMIFMVGVSNTVVAVLTVIFATCLFKLIDFGYYRFMLYMQIRRDNASNTKGKCL